MSAVIELLKEIRNRRPSMYIGKPSVILLAAFLGGYDYALYRHCAIKRDDFFGAFQEWVANRYSVRISQSWENIIQFQCVDEREAMELFWKLLDEFIAERPTEV